MHNSVIQTVLNLRQKLISGVAKLITRLMELDDFTKVLKDSELLGKVSNGITGINKKKFGDLVSSADALKLSGETVKRNTLLVQQGFGIANRENIVFANGRVRTNLLLINSRRLICTSTIIIHTISTYIASATISYTAISVDGQT